MRRINTATKVGKVNMPAPLSKEFALLLVLLVAAVWVAVAFAQEVIFTQQLNAQAADLQRQNAAITAANSGYLRDLSASSTGATAGEDARQHGYARPDEKVYVVGGPAPAATPAVVKVAVKTKTNGGARQYGLWVSLGRWIADFWHR